MTARQRSVMARTRNKETGEYNTNLRADDALAIFRKRSDRAKPLGSADIQEALGWSRGTVHNKLGELVERGALETRTIGSRTQVWWEPLPRKAVSEQHRGIPGSPQAVYEWVDIPARTEEVAQKRTRAIYAAYELLRDRGEATKEQLRDIAVETNPDDESNSPHNHWVNYVRDGLRPLPGTIPPGGGAKENKSQWRFIDPNSELASNLRVSVKDPVGDIRVPAEGTTAKRYRAMLQIAYNYLKTNKSARKADLEHTTPDYTGRYNNFEGFWSYFLRDALGNLPGVEPPQTGTRRWTYIEPDGELDRKLSIEQDDWLSKVDVSVEGEQANRLRALIQIAYNHLKESGRADKHDFEQALPEYTGHYTDFNGLWQYVLKDVLKEAPGVEFTNSETNKTITYIYTSESTTPPPDVCQTSD